MKLLALIALTVLTAPGSEAADLLSLDAAVHEAHEHSPALARSKAAAAVASWRRLEAVSANLPQLSASANHFFDEKYQVLNIALGGGAPVTFPAIYPKTTASLDATWTVFDGLKTPLAYGAAELNKDAAELEARRAEFALDAAVELKFHAALAAQLLASVAAQNVTTLRDHLGHTEERLRRGKATRFDTLRVETQLAEAEPEKISADDAVVTSRHELAVAMGLEADSRPLTGTLPPPTESYDTAKAAAATAADLANRDDIQALQRRSDAADREFHSSLGTLLPRVTLAAEKQWYNNTDHSLNFSSAGYNTAYSIGVFASWNLFDGGAQLARQAEAVHQREQAEATAREAVLRAPLDLDTWRRRLLYEASLYRARQHAVETANESVRLARLGYGAGTRTSTDVLDAELDLFRARAGLVRAQLDASAARINLELALGHRI